MSNEELQAELERQRMIQELQELKGGGDPAIRPSNPPEPKFKQKSKNELIREAKSQGIACCPKCGSTSLSANKKGFGIGKAVIGAAIAGPIGLIAGNKGAKNVKITCLSCGNQWKA